jgi:hypothetical protein
MLGCQGTMLARSYSLCLPAGPATAHVTAVLQPLMAEHMLHASACTATSWQLAVWHCPPCSASIKQRLTLAVRRAVNRMALLMN